MQRLGHRASISQLAILVVGDGRDSTDEMDFYVMESFGRSACWSLVSGLFLLLSSTGDRMEESWGVAKMERWRGGGGEAEVRRRRCGGGEVEVERWRGGKTEILWSLLVCWARYRNVWRVTACCLLLVPVAVRWCLLLPVAVE